MLIWPAFFSQQNVREEWTVVGMIRKGGCMIPGMLLGFFFPGYFNYLNIPSILKMNGCDFFLL